MKNVLAMLDQIGIDYVLYEHEPFFTCEDSAPFYEKVEGGNSKNLFLRNRKGDQHYLLVMEADKQANIQAVAKAIGESKLGFASPERLEKWLKLKPGSVSPFGLLNDLDKHVIVLIDQDLLKHEKLHYHPNVNTATVELTREDFRKFLDWSGHEVRELIV
ncbi:MAG: prolyl-tRNA synthetase associated domain-containing protein [Candidatus Peregrinibacteria bacterium]|nr:prolyl-tRNA synthetase associated domain-containing protein [Candidatus Peregrinibacteria bacterium]